MVLSLEVSVPAKTGCTVMVAVPADTPRTVITPLEFTVAVATPELEDAKVTLLLVVPSDKLTVAITELSLAPTAKLAMADLESEAEVTVGAATVGFTVKVLVTVPLAVVMVTVLSPAVAVLLMAKLAVIWVPALLTWTLEMVMPLPEGTLKVAPVKLVPINVTATVCPTVPEAGVIEVTVAAVAVAGLTTVTVMVLSLEVSVPAKTGCTVTVAVPAATPVIVITPLETLTAAVATLRLEDVTVTLLLVVPSDKFTAAVTVSVPFTVTDEADLESVTELTVAALGAVIVIGKELAEGWLMVGLLLVHKL
jgi:hypothetical protein